MNRYMGINLKKLGQSLAGELHTDELLRRLYATDASVYRELPLAVAYPKHTEDIRQLILFARENHTSLIPRAAGTSLAGQCVGNGIVVDVSRHMTKILEFNAEESWVRVQPGVIRDELNEFLKPHGLFFGPNTSTANRCMMGGMVGNNSCGTTSIIYGHTRMHLLALKTVLSDGSEVTFGDLNSGEWKKKKEGTSLEAKIYTALFEDLEKPEQVKEIRAQFPKASIHRRNTGYAVDEVLDMQPFTPDGPPLNLAKLLCGSEGTLAFITEIKLNLSLLPPPEEVMVCPHFHSMSDAMKGTVIAMEFEPHLCELMDRFILECTKANKTLSKNRFFVEGDPAAILAISLRADTREAAEQIADQLIATLEKSGLAYALPKVYPPDTQRVFNLRTAGLGLLSNVPGDAKPVACIEDTAVALEDLPDYVEEFEKLMAGHGQEAVFYAHAGAGELHLRPILDLRNPEHRKAFHDISSDTAHLVKKYQGSLSGEHGDGRVRAEFIPIMVGQKNYELFRRIKQSWDPQNIFNPGKIVDAPPMDESLRYEPNPDEPELTTLLDFSAQGGFLRAAEQCNGSGDCRKLSFSGGTMCPSYRATRQEKDSTRARANALREFLTDHQGRKNPFAREELYEVLDLCISCKGCTSECPSNVDMASMKAEFLHQYYQEKGVPLRARAFANINSLNRLAGIWPAASNFLLNNALTGRIAKNILGVALQRQLPALAKTTLRAWIKKNQEKISVKGEKKGSLVFFCDEFVNWYDVEIGKKTLLLLAKLGYEVKLVDHAESGRAHISKGLLPEAKNFAEQNVSILSKMVSERCPLVGIEPSAILSFTDEYPRLVEKELVESSKQLAANSMMVDTFLANEIRKGNITAQQFSSEKQYFLLHGHCHQKSLAEVSDTAWCLNLLEDSTVEVIPSGCCGMAGSFGYEKEHYEVSMQMGELVLFPAVRKAPEDAIIVAPGTSCRHQILDGTGRRAVHPVEVLWERVEDRRLKGKEKISAC
jgi:FAD/FMN-containing dehydrogenase/Fe-S oxidoreductase